MALVTKPLKFSLCRRLAEKRFEEAGILLERRKYSGAYYLSGYCIELALKAGYCKKVGKYNFPPEREIYNKLYSHDLNDLLEISGYKSSFETEILTDNSLYAAWGVVKEWDETTRYKIAGRVDAKSMISSTKRVLDWIKTKW